MVAASHDPDSSTKLGLHGAWAMAVGAMIDGGIFSVLGIAVEKAGHLAWASFVIAGLIALATGWSYVRLAIARDESGGVYAFLRAAHLEHVAAVAAWLLIAAYTLTISVYAYTFGHYLAEAMALPNVLAKALSAAIVLVLISVNLLGVAQATWVEIATVWGKVLILLALAGAGLSRSPFVANAPIGLGSGLAAGIAGATLAAAMVFMAYEGFQLLTYDYKAMRTPGWTLPRATLTAIATVTVVYVAVALGAMGLVSVETLAEKRETALAFAGKAAFGSAGLWLVALAAAFSTASAINATLFATARLGKEVAQSGDLPSAAASENRHGVPYRSLIALGAVGGAFGMLGWLERLVEVASFAFLLVFAVVNVIAVRRCREHRWVGVLGALGATASAGVLAVDFGRHDPWLLVVLAGIAGLSATGRLVQRRVG